MMPYADTLNTAVAAGFAADGFGRLVSYNGTEFAAIVRFRENPAGLATQRDKQAATGELKVLRADVASWARGDAVIIDSEGWKVIRQISMTPSYFKLAIERDRRVAP